MSENQRSPVLAEVFSRAREVLKRQLRVALVASVQSYDKVTQTVDVQPLVDDFVQQEDGTFAVLPFPVLTHVPVAFPGGGGMRLTFPLQPGDTGQLIVNDLSLDLWKQQGGHVTPQDQRRHHIADAVFYPGAHPDPAAWTSADDATGSLGPDAGPQVVFRGATIEFGGTAATPPGDALALASLVVAEINKLRRAYDAHTHTYTWTGTPGTGVTAPGPSAAAGASPGSAILKGE